MSKKIHRNNKTVVIAMLAVIIAGIGVCAYTQNTKNISTQKETGVDNRASKEVIGQNTISIYASDMKFYGEEFAYEVQSGSCSGTYSEEEIKNAFITSTEELKVYLAQFETVYNIGKNGSMRKQKVKAEDYFDEAFFKEHTLAIEVHNGSFTSDRYCLDSVTSKDETVNININYTQYSYGGELSPRLDFQFVILDKEVTQVNFNFKMKYINNEDYKDRT